LGAAPRPSLVVHHAIFMSWGDRSVNSITPVAPSLAAQAKRADLAVEDKPRT